MSGRLDGKVVVITGTGDGQGRTAALRFAEEGARVVGCDINEETAAETLRLVREAGGEMECLFPLDLTDESEAHRLMGHAAEVFGGIDVLYNNAMAMRLGRPAEMTLEDWNFTLTNTLTLHFLASKHAIPHLKARGGGSIIFISSTAGWNAGTGFSGNMGILFSYSVAKAGLNRFANILAVELGPHDIRVNVVSPAWIDVPSTSNVYGKPGSAIHDEVVKGLTVKRLGKPEEVVETALFLASGDVPYMTGANISVDGGSIASGYGGSPDPHTEEVFEPVVGEWLSRDTRWDEPR
jgi:meso-butanediol dehydrogenase/(S,S)-butanediol dehydrogenase/diacetyl reductase